MTSEPLNTAAQRVAYFVAASQFFYPAGLWLAGGVQAARAGALVLLVTPLFLLVPVVCRAHSTAGRLLLAVAGTLVTLVAAAALGTASLVEAYHLPVLVSAAALFRRSEARWRVAALSLPVLGLAIGPLVLPDTGWIGLAAAEALRPLHIVGAVVLSIYVGWQARFAWRT